MRFYIPQFQIASMQPPQTEFRSKFGGLPWGLPSDRWSWCKQCRKPMSLLAQLCHDPPALDLGAADHILHVFQCQECFGIFDGSRDAVIISATELGSRLTEPAPLLDRLVGELWLKGWTEHDDGLDPSLANDFYDERKWLNFPIDEKSEKMFDTEWRTKMGGIPYWTGNSPPRPPESPPEGYEFLFQLDEGIKIEFPAPMPNDFGGTLLITTPSKDPNRWFDQQSSQQDVGRSKRNAPWYIEEITEKEKCFAIITNFGTDGTAYFFINRQTRPPDVYWYWTR
jgi:hypothetical protein